MSVTLSLCMIVRDDAAVLERCLQSVAGLCDEIVILDIGSRDSTFDIARRYADHALRHPWSDDYAAARNASFAYASGDYLMWLDADEFMSGENLRRLLAWKDRGFDNRGMIAFRCLDELDSSGAASRWHYRERIFRRDKRALWQGFVCERVEWAQDIRLSDLVVTRMSADRAREGRILDLMKKRLPCVRRDPRIHSLYARELYRSGALRLAQKELGLLFKDTKLSDADRISSLMDAARIARAGSDADADIRYLFEALRYGTPSAELACEIGSRLAEAERWREAAYWYTTALGVPLDPRLPVLEEAHGFLPYIMLTECYERLGERELALTNFEAAKSLKPDHKYVACYEKLFEV